MKVEKQKAMIKYVIELNEEEMIWLKNHIDHAPFEGETGRESGIRGSLLSMMEIMM